MPISITRDYKAKYSRTITERGLTINHNDKEILHIHSSLQSFEEYKADYPECTHVEILDEWGEFIIDHTDIVITGYSGNFHGKIKHGVHMRNQIAEGIDGTLVNLTTTDEIDTLLTIAEYIDVINSLSIPYTLELNELKHYIK